MRKPMEERRKKLWIVIGMLAVIFISILFLIPSPGEQRYSDNPLDWVVEAQGNTTIDVDGATKGTSTVEGTSQQYTDGVMFTAFSYEIVFGGEFRKNPYIDESGKKIIEVTDTLDPDDGIIQLLMIERINAENAEVHIFVDKDWKDYFGSKARIVWGKEFQNQKALDYNEVSQGVYHDSVIDDPGRFPKGDDD